MMISNISRYLTSHGWRAYSTEGRSTVFEKDGRRMEYWNGRLFLIGFSSKGPVLTRNIEFHEDHLCIKQGDGTTEVIE